MLPYTLAALLAIFVAQVLWIYLSHRRAQHRDELFRIITENAGDVIAPVDTKGLSPLQQPGLSEDPRLLCR